MSERPQNANTGNPRDSRIGRRSLLKWLGGSAAAAALGSLAQPVFGKTQQQAGHAPHASAPSQSKRLRRWSMVIDLRSCDGCQKIGKPPQCTAACIEGHYAPEPMEWIEVYEQGLTGGGTRFIPTPCQQCQNSPCTNVCPVGATFHTPEGVVLIDQQRCIGCRICMEACPYDRRFFNWGDPPQPVEALFREYDPEHQSPSFRGTVMKCDFCPDMARAGRLPYCIQGCPNQSIYYGDLEEDLATNGVQVVKLSSFLSENAGFRLKEHYGTEPRVFYIPGHGQSVGRSPLKKGRKRTVWPWRNRSEGSETWTR